MILNDVNYLPYKVTEPSSKAVLVASGERVCDLIHLPKGHPDPSVVFIAKDTGHIPC